MRVRHNKKVGLAVVMGMAMQTGHAAELNAAGSDVPAAAATAVAQANTTVPTGVPPAPINAAPVASSNAVPSCARYNQYTSRIEVSVITMPVCLRIAPELGGLRSTLADHGFGLSFTSMLGYAYDLNGNNAQPQTYNGQNPTYNQTTSLYLTYDLTRIGFSKDAQFTFSAQWATSTYRPAYPHLATMSIFAVDQPLLGKQVELIYGFIPGVRLFYGMTLGGNASTSALGPQSVVPFQVGMSASEPTPTLDVIVRDPSLHFYNSFAITRSASPQGILKDIDLNPSGFRLTVPGARALFINEAGFKRAASANDDSMWLRVGALYNTSPYTRFDSATPSTNNYSFYLAATRQVTRPFGDARGLYLDAKFDWSPADRNAINRAVQASAFYVGPFAGRPFDMAAIGVTKSLYSADLRDRYGAYHIGTSPYTMAYTASYAARMFRGAYAISGLTYTKNPVFTPHHSDALLLQETLTFTF